MQRPDHPREQPPQRGAADQPAAWGVLRFLLGGAARDPPAAFEGRLTPSNN
ncbi:hypothetical protein [Streptomyces sp. NPDC054804]